MQRRKRNYPFFLLLYHSNSQEIFRLVKKFFYRWYKKKKCVKISLQCNNGGGMSV